MRNLTPEEQAELHNRCIFCKQDLFYEGPQGGMSFNIYCATCLAGFSITHESLPWQLIYEPGERTVADLVGIIGPAIKIPAFTEQLTRAIEKAMRETKERLFGKGET